MSENPGTHVEGEGREALIEIVGRAIAADQGEAYAEHMSEYRQYGSIAVDALAPSLQREIDAQAILVRVRKVRDGYADQAKFADVDPAAYFREFVRRLDAAVDGPVTPLPWGGRHPDRAQVELPIDALKAVVAAIGDWSRPTGANGMVPASEDHPLVVASRKAQAAINAAEGRS
tara:strand:- start:1863 stop:2384 length:522 start_codon:yes stop_codon:yes gene_type:complete